MICAAPRILSVVGGVIVRGPRVLLTQRLRSAPRWPDRWEFPGGKVEPGEDDAQALARELWEELRVRVRVEGQVARVRRERDDGRTLDFRAYRCAMIQGEPQRIEVQDLRWVTLEEAGRLTMPPADGPVLAALLAVGLE